MCSTPETDRTTQRKARKCSHDQKTTAVFIQIYCDGHHADMERSAVTFKTHDVKAITGKEIVLCDDCRKLLAHAFVKRDVCPQDPKPACKKCGDHCYAPKYRAQIREVMKYSGKQLVLKGRVDYLLHLLF